MTVLEIEDSLSNLIRLDQKEHFNNEIFCLKNDKNIHHKSKIRNLHPFVDSNNILRVGGRLEKNDYLPYDRKHPIIISYKSRLANLLIRFAHDKTLHGGNRITMNYIKNKYCILKVKSTIKFELHKCVICFRFKKYINNQLMGNLPKERTQISKPFTNTGTDFCGSFDIRYAKGRGNKSYKCYIAIFVCLATKAVHIEIVSDLTSKAFIAAFQRFVSAYALKAM